MNIDQKEAKEKIDGLMGEIYGWGLSDAQNKRAREILEELANDYIITIDNLMYNENM